MFMLVNIGTVGSVGGASDGNLSVSVDATIGDLRKALVTLVLTPEFIDKAWQARLRAIATLCNKDMPIKVGGEEKSDDALLKDVGFNPSSTHFNNMCQDDHKPPLVELTVFEPVATPEGIAEAKAAADVPAIVETDDVKCIGKCGFFGRQSGFCSKCWSQTDEDNRRFYSFAFNKIKATREEALALLAKTDELRKEAEMKRFKIAQEEKEKREAEAAERRKQNEERKAKDQCYQLDGSRLGDNWYIWSREDFAEGDCPYSFTTWTCGVRLPEHHHAAPCATESFEAMHTLITDLESKVKHATEHSEGSEPWSCFWISKDQQVSEGVQDGDNVPTRLRKALKLPDSVPWAQQDKVTWSKACFWTKEQYKSNADLAKLKAATTLLKSKCVKDSVHQLTFNPDHQGPCYPVFIAGLTKDGDHLLCCWSSVTWT